MDHLTRLYKNRYESLLEQYNRLSVEYNLMEATSDNLATMSPKNFEIWIKANPHAAEHAKKIRAERRAKLNLPAETFEKVTPTEPTTAEQPKSSTWAEREAKRAESRQAQREQTRKESESWRKTKEAGPTPSPSTKTPGPGEPGFEEFIKSKAEEMRKAAQQAKEKVTTPTPESPKTAPKQTPPETPAAVKPKKGIKLPSKASIAGFGIGLPAFMVGDVLTQKALEAAGVESEVGREIPGSAVGGAVADVAGLATTSALSGAGLPSAAALGAAALKGGLAGMAFYGGFKAGEALSNIEVNDKGETVADVGGQKLYDIKQAITGGKSAAEQLTTKKTGVAGGDPAQMAKLAKEEEELKQEEEERKKEEAAQIAKRVAEIKAGK